VGAVRRGSKAFDTSAYQMGESMISHLHERLVVATAVVSSAALLAGCGGSGPSASSTCQDFMNASSSDQQAVVEQLAGRYDKPEYATPLGSPEVPFYCTSNPTVTLGQFFESAQD
jgi:hypothetical protein